MTLSGFRPPALNLELLRIPEFWDLLNKQLSEDHIIFIVKMLAKVYKSPHHEYPTLSSQMKTRIEVSSFVITLKKYIQSFLQASNLKLLKQLVFFEDLITICNGILSFKYHSTNFLKEISSIIDISICTINAGKFICYAEILVKLRRVKEEFKLVLSLSVIPVSKNFKNLNIFPNRDDLLSNNKLDIIANIINGAYPSVEHYLDLQFKLLREDCFGPLREGIKKYMQNPNKTKLENIRVYPEVRIQGSYIKNNKIGHLVDISGCAKSNRKSVDCRELAQDKQLMFGSLLLFTCNNFETILCATVLDSDTNLLADGYIGVSFESPLPKSISSRSYLMVESEVFFEPYHRVLKVLQNSGLDDLPMKRYIVDVQTETRLPAYLTTNTVYKVENSKRTGQYAFPVLYPHLWPSESNIGLDKTQMEAYIFALTREFAVIQGPPGTGKTFIGVKIASTLLNNWSLKGRPMAIICYTNHALDQFLEGILGVTKDIVRLGGQSKSKVLEPYTLNNLKMNKKSKYSYSYAKTRSQLEGIFKMMSGLQNEIEKSDKELLLKKYIKDHPTFGYQYSDLKTKNENLRLQMEDLLVRHKKCNETLNNIKTLTDCELMKTKRVVGMTTTTAARRHDLMKELQSPIVIVEEAAEVLEAHVVASLTNNCKHLILIGDHKQLRPSAAHYKLAKEYNLEISLFERMIRNGVHARTLTTQRRMRPNFAELLVPEIYEKLDSHPNVFAYPNVRGMKDNLYFLTHNAFEDSKEEHSSSHKNTLEAKWCVALANYLREMKYESEEITILSTYTAQVSLISQLSKKFKLLAGVKVTSVDNYQGEENRIVILSLVRSNKDGKIGFLATENRVCVALSRAKEGFYIFGNMKVLKSASSLWQAINKKLLKQNAVGDKLTICCNVHKHITLEIDHPDKFNGCFSGSCLKNCNAAPERPFVLFIWSYIISIVRWRVLPKRENPSQSQTLSKNTFLTCGLITFIAYLYFTF